MNCALRPAGARNPASPSSAGARQRPDVRTGRPPARLPLLLPVLGLLFAALSLFAATPAAAQNAPTSKPFITDLFSIHLGYEVRWRDYITDDSNLRRDASVTGYDIQYRESGTTSWSDVPHSGNAWAARITGLTGGTEYQVRVRKTNAAGNGPWSDIEDGTAVATKTTTIDPPFGARVTPGNAKATFTWSAPAHKGGKTITGYRIKVREAAAGSTFSKTVDVSGATATSGEVTGLTNGTEYEGLVFALSATGNGATTAWLSFTPKAATRQVSFAQSSYSVAEGASVTLTVNVSPALTTASSVNVTTATSGTTAATSDYSVTGLTGLNLALPANATSATFTVAAASDSTEEDPERVEYVLEAVQNADYVVSGSGDTAVVTISDAQSNVATLSGLTASTSNSATGPFTALTLSPSTFAATTTSYTATVANSVTHVKLTPTVSDSGATVKVGVGTSLTAVSSGSASGAIALSVGANAIKAVVTAEDGTTTQTYTVTVTRQSTVATLSGLTASTSTSATGTFKAQTLMPSTFVATTTSYTLSVANSVTHVKLTPTVTNSGATVKVGVGTSLTAVTSGSASGAIALSVGANAIKAVVTAQDGTTMQTYTVTVTRQSNVATLSGLTASTNTSATGMFTAQTLTPSTFAATTTSYTASVANSITHVKLTPTVTNSGATVKVGVGTSLTAVTSASASGAIALSVGANAIKAVVTSEDGTTTQTYTVTVTRRQPPTMEFELDTLLVVESDTDPETPKVLLSEALTQQTTVQIRVRSYGNASPADFTLTTTTLTFAAGDTEKTFPVLAAADMLTEGNEVFTLELVAVASAPYTLGSNDHIELVIVDDSWTPGEPGETSLTAVESGANKPTATTLSFTVACATADAGYPLTDYQVHAVAQGVAGLERWFVFQESKCGTNGPVTLTGLPLRPTATTWRVRARARAIRGQTGSWSSDVELATVADPAQENAAALTASFAGVPSEHTGNDRRFSFTVNFNVSVDGGQVPTRRSFETSEGAVMQVVRVSGKKWTVHVRPTSWRKVGIALRGGRSCDDPHAVCATGGRALTNSPQASVGGAARIKVSSHWAKEGTKQPVRFIVKLNRAVAHEVRVDYATKDGVGMLGGNAPAAAGTDYTATSGTLVFAAGQRRKTVNVAVLDDSINEGAEYLLLALSNPQGAHLPHRQVEKVGLIRNHDPLPDAWLSRFGRTVAGHHVAAVRDRLAADRSPGLSARFAGQPLPQPRDGAAQAADADGMKKASPETRVARDAQAAGAILSSRTAAGDAGALAETDGDETLAFRSLRAFLAGDGAEASVQAVAADDVLLGTDFAVTRDAGHGLSHGFWGRAARSGFSGREGAISVEGTVTGVLLGTDWKRKGMTFGVIVSESRGSMTYGGGASSGAIDARLSALVPWAGLEIGQHSSLWGAAGIGRGDMTLRPDGQGRTVTGIGWSMAALGAEGALAPGARLGGASLGWHADALATRAESDAARTDTGNLAAGSGATTRMRLGLRAAWQRTLASGATLSPRIEAGVRHDGGDAETGIGLEVGGGIAFADPARGLSMSMDVRTLALHEDGNFKDWGLSLGLSWDPRPETKRGCSATAQHGLGGASAGGVDALFGPEAFPGAPGAEGGTNWSVEAACGTGRGRGMVGSPYARANGGGEAESLRVGYRIEPDADHAEDATVQAWADPAADGGSVGAGLEWRW